ncbi:MAG: glycosyl hydrolase family 18 protein [Erysipelotrichaceae bacterium]
MKLNKVKDWILEHKKIVSYVAIGVVLVAMVVGIVFKVMNGDSAEDKPKEEVVTTDKGETDKTDKKDEKKEECTGSAADTFKKETAYTGGQEVIFKGHKYKAKWWTQGEEPGAGSGVWEDLGEAGGNCTPSDDKEAGGDEPATVDKSETKATDFKVVAYYPSWEPDKLAKLQYDVVTHVNYAFAIPTNDGELLPLENEATAKKLIASAHKSNVKVLIAVGGWSYKDIPLEPTFVSATDSDAKIKKFGDNIIAMCDKYGFDGVDIDWEHPRVDGNSKVQYEALMKYLGTKLHAKNKLLTSAVLSGVTADGNVYYDMPAQSDAVLAAVDWINVMAYDGGDGERHSQYDFAVNCGKYWKDKRKMPANKVVLGVPFYARPSWASYDKLLEADKTADAKDMINFNGVSAYYNGTATITKKSKYAKENLGGVMIWEVTQDTSNKEKSLLSAIGKAVK